MPGRLEGKIAVVTGSNSGIGRGIAIAFGREGATVICANRQAESKTEAEKDITTNDLIVRAGGKAEFMKMTYTETESVNACVKQVAAKYGRIDVWVNNAGAAGRPESIWKVSDEEFDGTLDINLKGTFKCIRAASAQMIEQDLDSAGLRGRIINICSVFGPRGFPMVGAYSAAKLGLMGLIRSAAQDLSPHKITINAICPGTVETAATGGMPEPMMEYLKGKSLMGFGKPEDIAGPALLLASDDGKWMQGAELFVDGGFTVV